MAACGASATAYEPVLFVKIGALGSRTAQVFGGRTAMQRSWLGVVLDPAANAAGGASSGKHAITID